MGLSFGKINISILGAAPHQNVFSGMITNLGRCVVNRKKLGELSSHNSINNDSAVRQWIRRNIWWAVFAPQYTGNFRANIKDAKIEPSSIIERFCASGVYPIWANHEPDDLFSGVREFIALSNSVRRNIP